MVVFLNGEKEPSMYRRFKIKDSKNDDFSSMREIVERRIKHFVDWGIPDLIIIDGGKPQLLAVFDLLTKNKVPFLGIAKKEEEIVIPRTEGEKMVFAKMGISGEKFGNLIIRIRDESHRFAIKYHRLLQGKIKNG